MTQSISTTSSTTLIGSKVCNPAGENLATLKGVVVDKNTGEITCGVLLFGGVSVNKLFAVPWQALELNADWHCLVLHAWREQLEEAVEIHLEDWSDLTDPDFAVVNRTLH